MNDSSTVSPVNVLQILGVWVRLGGQSFGGGSATLALIRRAAVEEQQWVTEAEFGHFWALVQLAPGINLLALTILIGRRTAGLAGAVAALLGLLLPSVSVTVLLTAGYVHVQHLPWIQAALRGIVPAVVGLGGVTIWQITVPLLRRSHQRGWVSFVLSLMLLFGSALAAWEGHLPILAILLPCAFLSAAGSWISWHRQPAHRSKPLP